jgi:hypothetical protein
MQKMMLFSIAALVLAASPTFGAETHGMPPDHGVFTPANIQWGEVPPVLPAGAKMAVLKGDPSKEGIFVIRVKVPADYKIMPHWHPAYENVTVISGEANIGMGDVFDKTKGVKIPTGGFGFLAPQMHHYFWADVETVIQIHGFGPWQLYYLNPNDDPRQMATKK